MIKNIVIINGAGGVGKDTFVEKINNYVKAQTISSVDLIKDAAKIIGWDGLSKTETDRKFLSDLKILAGKYNDHSVAYIKDHIDQFMMHSNDSVLFIMIREPEEIELIAKCIPVTTLLILNDRVPAITSNPADNNVLEFSYDYVVDNCGELEDLDRSAKEFLDYLYNRAGHSMITPGRIGGIF